MDNELTQVNLICEIIPIVLKDKIIIASSLYSNTRLYGEGFITTTSRFNFVLRSSHIPPMDTEFNTKKARTTIGN